jgi:hypothetical protein
MKKQFNFQERCHEVEHRTIYFGVTQKTKKKFKKTAVVHTETTETSEEEVHFIIF